MQPMIPSLFKQEPGNVTPQSRQGAHRFLRGRGVELFPVSTPVVCLRIRISEGLGFQVPAALHLDLDPMSSFGNRL